MKSSLEKLREVQQLDHLIFARRSERDRLPREIEYKTKEVEEMRKKIRDTKNHIAQLRLKQKQKEGDLANLEAEIQKKDLQLNKVKSNRDYSALLQEINLEKEKKSELEDDILVTIEEIDRTEIEENEIQKHIGMKEKEYESFNKQHQIRLQDVKAELQGLEKKRNAMMSDIDTELLEKYERILSAKGGEAMVEAYGSVDAAFCGACHIQLLPNDVASLMGKDSPVFCNNCGRILYMGFE